MSRGELTPIAEIIPVVLRSIARRCEEYANRREPS